MLVDDDRGVREVGLQMMEMLGYQAFSCASADEAIERVSDCDIVFTDILMDDDADRGIDLIKRIRASGNDIPIVAISSRPPPQGHRGWGGCQDSQALAAGDAQEDSL